MNDKKTNKIHQRVADVLGMSVPTEDDLADQIEETPLVALPTDNDLVPVDNSDLPTLRVELERLEHAQRQTEYLLEHAMPTIIQSLAEISMMPPIYKARSVEANAKLLDVVREMLEQKSDLQLKIMDLRMKMVAFTRNKTPTNDFTGNTFVFNREELMKHYPVKVNGKDEDS